MQINESCPICGDCLDLDMFRGGIDDERGEHDQETVKCNCCDSEILVDVNAHISFDTNVTVLSEGTKHLGDDE